jgi:hypothetical protein
MIGLSLEGLQMRLKYCLPLFSASHQFNFSSLDSHLDRPSAASVPRILIYSIVNIKDSDRFEVYYLECECVRYLLFIVVLKHTLDAMVIYDHNLFSSVYFPSPAFRNREFS